MKICIAHFRVGLTDGVSLQIDERATILKQLGHEVSLIADNNSPGADLAIPFFDYKNNLRIKEIQKAAFGTNQRESSDLKKKVTVIVRDIEAEIEEFWRYRQFTLLFVHNIFSLPVCLPATIAVYNFLLKHPQIKTVGIHHDFYWDPPRINKYLTKNEYIKKVLKKYFPPKLDNINHTVLSTWEQKKLKNLQDIEAEVITDTFDFSRNPWNPDESNKDFLKDANITDGQLVFLIASRVRPRKGIEIGIDFTAWVNRLLKPKGNRRAVLVLPNDYFEDEKGYIKLLKEKAEGLKVEIRWLQDLVGSEEQKEKGMKKYSLWDCYAYADTILYPSLWEGFGNQFLEAVFAKKPIITLEYPVFKTDVKPKGFEVINISDKVALDSNGLAKVSQESLKKATVMLLKLLDNKREYKRFVNKNFRIGKSKFHTKVQLKKYLIVESERFIKSNGILRIISPLLLSGKLIASGIMIQRAYGLAESIIAEVPAEGLTNYELFTLTVKHLPDENKIRYVTLELVKEFLTSPKSKNPLFIFLGGLSGKSTLANLVVQQLGIEQPIAFDNEKYHIAKPGESKPFLWKATYESAHGYVKTVEAMYPHLLWMMGRNLFDYKRYKKWCYFWEGIYLSSQILRRIHENYPNIYYLSVFNLPKFSDIKRQYLLRWQNELGLEQLKKRKNIIDQYLKNVKAIRSNITKGMEPIASFVIESSVLEERLTIFYAILYQRLKDIADKEISGWVEKVTKRPELIKSYKKFLTE